MSRLPAALPSPGAVADLMRLPAVLTAPGDVLLGAASAGEREGRAVALAAGSSCLLYLAGMALNDYADREVDAAERPGRPIPSGRVDPGFALALASALTAASVALAAGAGGRRLAMALPLSATVWTYDLLAKDTRAGPAAMAAARSLDVLLGAGAGRLRRALPEAAVVGAHTLMLSLISRREIAGTTGGLARAALAGTGAVTGAAAALARGRLSAGGPELPRRRRGRATAAAGLLLAYATALGHAELEAMRDPNPARVQQVVGRGVLGLMPLEAGMLASAGRLRGAAALAGGWVVALRLARRRMVT